MEITPGSMQSPPSAGLVGNSVAPVATEVKYPQWLLREVSLPVEGPPVMKFEGDPATPKKLVANETNAYISEFAKEITHQNEKHPLRPAVANSSLAPHAVVSWPLEVLPLRKSSFRPWCTCHLFQVDQRKSETSLICCVMYCHIMYRVTKNPSL